MMKEKKKLQNEGFVASVLMGLGHIRAAWPLKDVSKNGLLLYSGPDSCSKKEFKIWNSFLKAYYFMSNAEKIPIIGKLIYHLLMKAEEVPPLYPKKDYSKPNIQAKYLRSVIRRGLCKALAEKIKSEGFPPIVSTYFALSIGINELLPDFKKNYLLCTDTDLNRVWAPVDSKNSNIIFLAPSDTVVNRLISFGVPENKIILTGFPLPKENIGNEKDAKILKKDLFERILRLDPKKILIGKNRNILETALGKNPIPAKMPDFYTVMFAIGGAGAQFEIAEAAVFSLKNKIREGKIKFVLSAGTKPKIGERFKQIVKKAKLDDLWTKGVDLVCDKDYRVYLEEFNKTLRHVDVLWTKPSELSFYTGLAIPILCAPPIGPHEERNRDWILGMGAGLTMPGDAIYCNEWLEDMRNDGRLAWCALNGFMRAPRNGTFVIEKILHGEKI